MIIRKTAMRRGKKGKRKERGGRKRKLRGEKEKYEDEWKTKCRERRMKMKGGKRG